MALTRDKQFYNLLDKGLASMGYVGDGENTALHYFVQDQFAEKYNAEATFAQMGFGIGEIMLDPKWEQIDMLHRPYTMAAYVDVDSDGPTKSTDGFSLATGNIPTFKHEISMSRKSLRNMMKLMNKIGHETPDMVDTYMDIFYNSVDDLLGGNYNTMRFQRNRIVSDFGRLRLNDRNNPLGYKADFGFQIPEANFQTLVAYTKNAEGVVTENETNIKQLIKKMKNMREAAQNQPPFVGAVHWEVEKESWEDLISTDYIRFAYAQTNNPLVSSEDTINLIADAADDAAIKTWFEKRIGARIEVIDFIGAVERWNPTTKAIEYYYPKSFKEGVFVMVPDGEIGEVQGGDPFVVGTPGTEDALYDGGMTWLRTQIDDDTMMRTVKSETTAFCVLNSSRYLFYLTFATIAKKKNLVQQTKTEDGGVLTALPEVEEP